MGTRKKEAQESLQSENIERESAFLININQAQYIIHITQSKEEVRSADMSLSINQEHRQHNEEALDISERVEVVLMVMTPP